MTASEKEIRCIEVSRKITLKLIDLEMQGLEKKTTPFILTPSRFRKDFPIGTLKANTSLLKRVFAYFFISVVSILIYIILFVVYFVVGIASAVSSQDNSLKTKRKQIEDKLRMDYQMSENKTFTQIWHDKGLLTSHFTSISSSEIANYKKQCIYEWFKILYGDFGHIEGLYEELKGEQNKVLTKFYLDNPRAHLSLSALEDSLPDAIDDSVGNYKP